MAWLGARCRVGRVATQDVVGQCIELAYGEQEDTASERLAETVGSRGSGSEVVGLGQAKRDVVIGVA